MFNQGRRRVAQALDADGICERDWGLLSEIAAAAATRRQGAVAAAVRHGMSGEVNATRFWLYAESAMLLKLADRFPEPPSYDDLEQLALTFWWDYQQSVADDYTTLLHTVLDAYRLADARLKPRGAKAAFSASIVLGLLLEEPRNEMFRLRAQVSRDSAQIEQHLVNLGAPTS